MNPCSNSTSSESSKDEKHPTKKLPNIRRDAANFRSLTNSIMLELMQKREFKELWAKLALEIEEEEEAKARDEKILLEEKRKENIEMNYIVKLERPKICPRKLHLKFEESSPRPDPALAKSFRQLTEALKLAVETFARGTQLIDSHGHPMRVFNREAAFFYSVRVQLDRFLSSGQFRVAQFGLVAKGLEKSGRLFVNFISSPYSLEMGAFLANSLLEMFLLFLDYSSLFEQAGRCSEAHWLSQAVVEFEEAVCQRLDKKLLSRRRRSQPSNSHPVVNPLQRSRSMTCGLDLIVRNSRVVLVPFPFVDDDDSGQTGKSFLLAPDLEYGRAKMASFRDGHGRQRRRFPSRS